MSIQVVTVALGVATNSVAAQTGVDLAAAAQLEVGPAFPNVGPGGNAILVTNLDAGATPGTFAIKLQESHDDDTYADVATVSSATGIVQMVNVTISRRYVRLNVTDATANAGTVDMHLISG